MTAAETSANIQQQSSVDDWGKRVHTGVRWPAAIGILVIVGFVAGFGIWASSAPLSGAAVAPGVVAASGQNLTIQHFEGGIVEAINVREGERVVAGDPVLTLDPTDAQAKRAILLQSLIALQANAERLQAERDGSETFSISSELQARAVEAGISGDLAEQAREFQKRRERLETDQRIANQSSAALSEKIVGLEAQIRAANDQITVLDDDIEGKRRLLKRGLTRKSEVNNLLRSRSDLEGRIGQLTASVAEARTAIIEAEQRKVRLTADLSERAATQLNEVRRQIADTRQRIRAADKVLERVVIRAPADGIIVTLNKNTPGSVVRPGEDLAVLLPEGGELIVEARVNPLDADIVSVGQAANLRFSSLNARITPEVPGTVAFIAADRVTDPVTNEPYFPARLKIADELPDAIRREQIFPGMPVETFIKTTDRTFLQYLMRPIMDSFERAFREPD